ncbi:MAG: arginine deiminase family protein, partial [Candidatus Omnitrophica bacterium]|nr:arginine deiminase family protein [Candidatus Omnitrophota bacterium]
LCKPPFSIQKICDPRSVLHSRAIDYASAVAEYTKIVEMYRAQKIKTCCIHVRARKGGFRYPVFNLMFTRDLFFMTPRGAVICRMGTDVRSQETVYAERFLRKTGIRVRAVIAGPGTFEGADAVWITGAMVAVGVGRRTNEEGFRQLREELARDKITCCAVPNPRGSIHLLGSVQLVDSSLALVRSGSSGPEIRTLLKKNRYRIVTIPENNEVIKNHAMNFVVLGPRKIVMPSGCPETRKIYERAGITVVGEISVTQLINGGGGLACASGILSRG